MKNTKISFIGCGNMGCSLIGGLIADGHNPAVIAGGEPDSEKAASIAWEYNIRVSNDNLQAIQDAEVIILSVKPQNLLEVIRDILPALSKTRPLLISIAAGIQTSSILHITGDDFPVVRAMPNTPALIQTGASALYASPGVSEDQRGLAEEIMRSVGLALWLDNESLLDSVTALSGSGPAYFFLVMECMQNAAIKLGLSQEHVRLLTLETAFGAAKMALESKTDVRELRRQVTSPGGTTQAALNVLIDEGQIESLFLKAMQEARKRSEELALEFGKS
jgi:pyrroline-5-carboxylate reductase